MASNKSIVEEYMAGFRSTDRPRILSCLTDDVIWDMPGFFRHEGKAAFNKEIENPEADGHPHIAITRMVEEGNIVVAEGSVRAKLKGNREIDALFCDDFQFRGHT